LTLIAVTVVAVGAIIGLAVYALSMRSRIRRPLSVAGLFEVSVSVPSVGKNVTLEVAPDHNVGSLVDSVASTLNLPKGKGYVVEYAGKLISRPDFGKTLGDLGIKEGSKLTLREL
jgi:hypothetical protein